MKLRDNKGSITIFVLVGLLFMSSFLLLSYGSNVNKSKTAKEMFKMISNIYSYNDGDENAYMRAYTVLRKQNAQEMTSSSENSDTLEFTKSFYGPISNYKIYGNSIQDTVTYGTPSPTNPVEIQSVGELVTDTTNENYGKYKIPVKVSGSNNLFNAKAIKNTNIKVKDNGKNIVMPIVTSGNGYTTTNSKLSELCPDLKVGDVAILSLKSNTSTNPMIYLTSVADLWYRNTTRTITQEMLDSTVVLYGNRYMDGDTIQKTITDLQIEKGTVVTEYEPYVESQTVNIYLDEPLRKVGDKSDYIDFRTGKVVRQVRKLSLNITDMNNSEAYPGWTQVEYLNQDYPSYNTVMSSVTDVVCNISNSSGIGINTNGTNAIIFLLTNIFNLTQTQWKETYPDLRVNIAYALSTPDDSKTIEIPELKSYEDYTKIEVLTEIAPSKI